ncbi:chromosome partitioning protein ParA [Vibrio sp. T187]|uniref:AAA family ATPase n=1 Tax=Vibrio TaxID=662 RepID=UPI0010C99A1D|nr:MULTISPECIES: chromosome partitioning protein ParA [Vibrio]MBW3694704.1 chromosome partitioning protein ParA [Vibrio sp. T187]
MFDLVDILKTKVEEKEVVQEQITSVVFHQTQACIDLVEEAFRFEGILPPSMLNNSDENIKQHVREAHIEIAIVELNVSQNVTEDMKRISHLLPNSASVIVIGSEDAISTIRNLKDMGFYYVFWPISKQELIDFVRNVDSNRKLNSGLGKDRTAKKVAVWGAKGGVGATMLTAEIAYELSAKKKSSCLIVDHDFRGGNLDIFLGEKHFQKKPVAPGALTANLDVSYASSMIKKLNDMLAVLAVESDELNELELKEYARSLSAQMAGQYNFILEDLSRSSNSKLDLKYIAEHNDILALVLEPTVSSVRECKRVLTALDSMAANVRCIVVVNYTMAEKAATISTEEIGQFLGRKIDVVCPNEIQVGKMVLEGKHIYQLGLPISKSLNRLTSLLLGESERQDSKSVFSKMMKRFK